MKGFKVTTHDLRPPIQGGNPLWDGTTPFDLPRIECDMSDNECAHGYNFTLAPDTALRIAGLWPTGRPSRIWHVEANGEAITRGDKCRSPVLHINCELTEAETNAAIAAFSKAFGGHAEDMAKEQILWREALALPEWDEGAVERCLQIALKVRGCDWKLKRYDSARAARAAWEARDAWTDRAAWAAWDAWDARAARAAWEARAAWTARAAWAAWEARDAWTAWAARDARDALTVQYASRQKWTGHPADLLTVGIRDAYRSGMAIALPTGPNELGWACRPERISDGSCLRTEKTSSSGR